MDRLEVLHRLNQLRRDGMGKRERVGQVERERRQDADDEAAQAFDDDERITDVCSLQMNPED